MKIAVVGTGYVGLVTGTCFAETGNYVTCIDIDKEKVESLKKGKMTMMEDYAVIVDKSTVPVGTAEKVSAAVQKNAKVPFDVVSNPEFLREGVAVEDFMKPDRVVIGTKSTRAKEIMERLYAPLVRQGNPVIFMDERSAEMTKYAANSFLAMKITFMNEIANLCEIAGADVDNVRKGIGTDSRIGKRFLFPGIGYGGSCFPKDVQALGQTAKEYGYDFKILKSVMLVNERQKTKLVPRLKEYFGGSIKGKTIALWGLAFKPHTDDIREAPALYNIKALKRAGAKVVVFDPEAVANVKKEIGKKVKYAKNPYEAAEGADALMIMTEWPEFRTPDFEKLSAALKTKVICDGRNLYELKDMEAMGYDYFSIGRETISAKI
ncbi:MAG: UDP-glucose/GDP-mannose dehydrogenase family protein [Cytophagaceae bacterium]|nr:UDP-glucose/GDP-mannose dehydrogenase family protein [Cytophagaceae bacterium]